MDIARFSRLKRLALTLFVVLSFVGYSVHQRGGGLERGGRSIVPPKTATNPNSPVAQTAVTTASTYRDGTYTGDVADAYYGNIQVQVVISGGKLIDVKFLQYPHDNPNSVYINSQAMPYLKQEAVQAQKGSVDIISGATDTSGAFIQSLTAALNQAKV